MEYTVRNLAQISGVSSRTLRYYDEIDLLKPCRINSSGYRIYGDDEVNLLQQILFYKELELPLDKIKAIISNEEFDYKKALHDHKESILKRQEQLILLLNNVEKTIKSLEGDIDMKDEEKFQGLKKEMIKENEGKYGKEIREKYGEDTVNESYNKFSKLTKYQMEEVENLGKEINETIKEAMKTGDTSCKKAQEAVELHKKWVNYFWKCEGEAHISLAQMYVDDERFTKYYEDNIGKNAAVFLRDSVVEYYNEILK